MKMNLLNKFYCEKTFFILLTLLLIPAYSDCNNDDNSETDRNKRTIGFLFRTIVNAFQTERQPPPRVVSFKPQRLQKPSPATLPTTQSTKSDLLASSKNLLQEKKNLFGSSNSQESDVDLLTASSPAQNTPPPQNTPVLGNFLLPQHPTHLANPLFLPNPSNPNHPSDTHTQTHPQYYNAQIPPPITYPSENVLTSPPAYSSYNSPTPQSNPTPHYQNQQHVPTNSATYNSNDAQPPYSAFLNVNQPPAVLNSPPTYNPYDTITTPQAYPPIPNPNQSQNEPPSSLSYSSNPAVSVVTPSDHNLHSNNPLQFHFLLLPYQQDGHLEATQQLPNSDLVGKYQAEIYLHPNSGLQQGNHIPQSRFSPSNGWHDVDEIFSRGSSQGTGPSKEGAANRKSFKTSAQDSIAHEHFYEDQEYPSFFKQYFSEDQFENFSQSQPLIIAHDQQDRSFGHGLSPEKNKFLERKLPSNDVIPKDGTKHQPIQNFQRSTSKEQQRFNLDMQNNRLQSEKNLQANEKSNELNSYWQKTSDHYKSLYDNFQAPPYQELFGVIQYPSKIGRLPDFVKKI